MEEKTVLSNKSPFSLPRMILILALASVASYAVAAEFSTTLSVDDNMDVSHAEGVQVQYGAPVDIKVRFGKVVNHDANIPANATGDAGSGTDTFAKDDVEIIAYNAFGGTVPPPRLTATGYPAPANPPDGQNFTLQLAQVADTTGIVSVLVRIPEHVVYVADPRADLDGDGIKTADGKNAAGDITIHYVNGQPTPGSPVVHFIKRTDEIALPVTEVTFDVLVQVSEEPRAGTFTKDSFSITNAAITQVTALGAFNADAEFGSTGRDGKVYKYLLTVAPAFKDDGDIVIKIESFEDQETPRPMKYTPPATDAGRTEGKDMLTVKVDEEGREDVIIVIEISVPTDPVIPGAGDASPPQNVGADDAEAAAPTAETRTTAEAAAPTAAAADTSVMIPMEGQIYISEIMFAGGGTLPQWIEISNGSRTEQVNLSGWTLTVKNATADTDVSVGAKVVLTIPEGTKIDPSGQHDTPATVLIATDRGRNNLDGNPMADDQIINLWVDQQVELTLLGITNRRYSLLSDIAFRITLAPPTPSIVTEQQTTARAAATDVVGNLADDGTAMWVLPMHEGGARSSIIRRHVSAEPVDSEMKDAWVLASDTGFAQSMPLTVRSYNGLPTDIGTPGFRAGGALPVELSHFRPVRDKATGAVVITWSTQSELNNAGFFIKRSQQRDGEFQVINATMIRGAGTTSEQQFYTYTDTTAQPNVVYYYQIEDVSLDGNRQTLTRGIRLKGHIGAAGKTTTMWGDLKAQE